MFFASRWSLRHDTIGMTEHRHEGTMKLTVLGNNGPYPAPGGACSGYLLQHDGACVVLDLGSGALANLMAAIDGDVELIDAVILSHHHSDHTSDISVLRYALEKLKKNSSVGKDGKPIRLPVYCPPAPEREFSTLKSYTQFEVTALGEDSSFAIRGLSFSFAPMTHSVPAFAICAECGGAPPNRCKLVYTGDTAWDPRILQFAEGADALVADACLLSRDKQPGKAILHMTADECGIAAAEANAKRLLLTHFTPGSNVARHVAEARAGVQKVSGRTDRISVEPTKLMATYEITSP